MFLTTAEAALKEGIAVHEIVRLIDEQAVDTLETEDGLTLVCAESLARAIRDEELERCDDLPADDDDDDDDDKDDEDDDEDEDDEEGAEEDEDEDCGGP